MIKPVALRLSAIFCLLLMLTTSCSDKNRTLPNNEIEFDTIIITKNYHLNNDSTLPSCNLKLKFAYPTKYKDAETLANLENIFLLSFFDEIYKDLPPAEAVNKYADNYISNFKKDAEEFFKEEKHEQEEGSSYFSCYESLSNEIKFNKAGLISFLVTQTNYKGGSKNSFEQYMCYVVSLDGGVLLREDDIFEDGYQKLLHEILLSKLRLANNDRSISDLEAEGYFMLDEMSTNNNFLIDENGITYIFNRGEYSALQMNEIRITIPYKEIAMFIKKDSPIAIFL